MTRRSWENKKGGESWVFTFNQDKQTYFRFGLNRQYYKKNGAKKRKKKDCAGGELKPL